MTNVVGFDRENNYNNYRRNIKMFDHLLKCWPQVGVFLSKCKLTTKCVSLH